MMLATVTLWAFNLVVTKYVFEHGFEPLSYAVIRYGAAAALFVAFTWRREGSIRVRAADWKLLAGATVLLVLNQVAFVYALKLGSAATTGLILGATPVFAVLLAAVLRVERLTTRKGFATAVSFGGVALIALGSGGKFSDDVVPDLLAVVMAVTWAAYSVLMMPLMKRYSPYRVSAVVLLATILVLGAVGGPQTAGQDYSLGWLVWLCLAYAIVGPLFLTNIFYFTAIKRVGASHATIYGNLQPFLGAFFALLLLSEDITALEGVGGVLIAAGIVLIRWRPRRVWRRRSVPSFHE
jgi:drug/metabolite transporter (DMT)-like permease